MVDDGDEEALEVDLDAEQRGNGRGVAGVDQIDRAGKPLAIRQRFHGVTVFGGVHAIMLAGLRAGVTPRDLIDEG